MKPKLITPFLLAFSLILNSCGNMSDSESFVRVSEDDPRYFCLSNGETYIPIGCNIAAMSSVELMEHYMEELHKNGGNFARVWLNSDFFEIQKSYGVWDETSIAHIDRLLELADAYGIKVKMCIESFRMIKPGRNKWNVKASYHVSNGGPFEDMQEYISSEKGKEEFLRRLEYLRQRYGNHPSVFGWELWNEMNAVEATGIEEWNVEMLAMVHEMFPENLVMQSLGSLDNVRSFDIYEYINKLPSNDVMQVHRYIDEGAPLEICSAPSDLLCSDAIAHMKSYGHAKPILLAEGGAVKPVHTGPHGIYERDTLGTVLHDFLFAPFFCGSAGSGHLWHWDHYIDKVDVWYQIGRFSEAIKGIDPVKESLETARNDSGRMRVYTLAGEEHIISWCRDTTSTWKNEWVNGVPAETLADEVVDLSSLAEGKTISKVEIYDPWNNVWTEAENSPLVRLPEFKRSLVIKLTL